MEKQNFWSRSKLGRSRVYWVVGDLLEDETIADGYTETVEEAEELARRIAGSDARSGPTSWVANRHRRKVYEARMSRPAKFSGAQIRRYVYWIY